MSTTCEKCGAADGREIQHCELVDAWLCWRCYIRATSLAWQLEAVLTSASTSRSELARQVGRDRRDRSVERALEALARHGLAVRETAGWRLPATETRRSRGRNRAQLGPDRRCLDGAG
jgi:hypothetical protein